jgi:D-alanyl-D-alanine carboxypeptidase/D-alanyl-D-alanine-endopeptidase (penicillin-binding protein 4)
VTNKVSQNLHAELLLRLLGRAQGDDGSVAQGVRVVRSFLVGAGVDPDDFTFRDGSGLSPDDLVTPRAVTTLLVYANRQPWGGVYRASLPVGGVDGSLSGRFAAPALKGKLQAKTGTLGEVNALSGYLTAASGRALVFSVIVNDRVGDGARGALDKVVAAIAAAY